MALKKTGIIYNNSAIINGKEYLCTYIKKLSEDEQNENESINFAPLSESDPAGRVEFNREKKFVNISITNSVSNIAESSLSTYAAGFINEYVNFKNLVDDDELPEAEES